VDLKRKRIVDLQWISVAGGGDKSRAIVKKTVYPSSFIKCREILGCLKKYQYLKEGSA
jgi:hypothetical protein